LGNWKKHILITALLFLLFGFSDIVEVYTGAWWSPWWLFVWKILNIIALLYFVFKFIKSERFKQK